MLICCSAAPVQNTAIRMEIAPIMVGLAQQDCVVRNGGGVEAVLIIVLQIQRFVRIMGHLAQQDCVVPSSGGVGAVRNTVRSKEGELVVLWMFEFLISVGGSGWNTLFAC